jgi:hypothetical protein
MYFSKGKVVSRKTWEEETSRSVDGEMILEWILRKWGGGGGEDVD